MYQVLYRKWRPRTFSEVVGQPYVTAALKNEVRTGRLAHAYLFVGSRGTGKTSCAKILAKAVNCLHPVDGNPCGECEICRGIDDGSVLDVMEMDAASNNGVDYIRELREEVAYMPSVARYRVYIIDEVHMMTDSAFNALLKTLEEPPEHVVFILATTEPHRIPATILSRCQRFDFGRIPAEDIAARLREVAEHEEFTLTEDAALLLARLADGGMRDALSLLDQCVSRTDNVTGDVVAEATGLAGREYMYELSAAIRDGNGGAALELIDRLHGASKDMERLCAESLDFFRQLMLCQAVREPGRLMALPAPELVRLQQESTRLSPAAVLHCLDVLQRTMERMRGSGNRRLEMEMTALKLCTPSLDADVTALARRVQAVEDAVRSGAAMPAAAAAPAVRTAEAAPKPAQVIPVVTAPPAEAPAAPRAEAASAAPAAPAPAGAGFAAETETEVPFDRWSEVLSRLAESCPPLYGVLLGSTATLRGDRVLIATENEMFRTLVSRDGNNRLLSAAIRAACGQSYRIGLKKTAVTAAPPAEDALSAFLRESREKGIEIEERR